MRENYKANLGVIIGYALVLDLRFQFDIIEVFVECSSNRVDFDVLTSFSCIFCVF